MSRMHIVTIRTRVNAAEIDWPNLNFPIFSVERRSTMGLPISANTADMRMQLNTELKYHATKMIAAQMALIIIYLASLFINL